VLYLGLPVIGSSSPGNTAFLSSTDLTATAGQTVFASAGSYTPGFVQVFRNGARLGNADFTATNGTTITLASAATAGDLVTIEYYTLTSLTNALPLTGGTVTGSTTFNSAVTINGAAASGFTGMKNRIINGNMAISQRGTSFVSPTGAYTIDRWEMEENTDGTVTVTQETDAPTGFNFSQKFTVTAADTSLAATQDLIVGQYIEGFNTADLVFGSASAATVTLSFWVKSSLTGTFGGALQNSARTRSYPFTYTISVASTWEQKTVTIAGDTSGTWIGATNGIGLRVYFGLGVGSTYSGTAGAWAATNYYSATGAVSVIGTNAATWQVTGVQLERGSNATSFEFIDYGRQLIQCQRYFETISSDSVAYGAFAIGFVSGTSGFHMLPYKVIKRANPTITSTAANTFLLDAGAQAGTAIAFDRMTTGITRCQVTVGSALSGSTSIMMANNTSLATISISSEL
jgi:hypothetical protein